MTIQEFETEEDLDDAFDDAMEEKAKLNNARPRPQLAWSCDVVCPKCDTFIDLTDDDWITDYIFTNRWNEVRGETMECPECEHEFTLGEIEY